MKLILKAGQTSQRIFIFVQDSSATTGVGLSGLTNASSGLIWYVAREDDGNAGGTAVSIVSATKGTFTSGGFVEKDATNMKGVYELGIPNTALATGSKYCVMMLSGATNMAPVLVEIELVTFDPFDTVRLGLTSIPNVAQGNAGQLPTADSSGRVTVITNSDKTGYSLTQSFPANFASLSITAGGRVAIQGNVPKNTALNDFEFLMTDSTSHNPAPGKSVTVTRSIDNGAFAGGTLSAVTEIANGMYSVNFGAGDLNGGVITLRATAAGCDDLFVTFITSA